MGFIIWLVVVFVIYWIVDGLCKIMDWADDSHKSSRSYKEYRRRDDREREYSNWMLTSSKASAGKSQKNDREEFEEADSVFDKNGNEHIVDDDGYCDDCDEFH